MRHSASPEYIIPYFHEKVNIWRASNRFYIAKNHLFHQNRIIYILLIFGAQKVRIKILSNT